MRRPMAQLNLVLVSYRQMKVTIISFSYKRGLPDDSTGNGGGFVFDCRAMPNPYWDKSLRGYTGRDKPIVDFFAGYKAQVDEFLDAAESLVRQSVQSYLKDGRENLQVAFGCTGGQHRSVYFAESMKDRLAKVENVSVDLIHTAWPCWVTVEKSWITVCADHLAFAHIRPPCSESELTSDIGDIAGFTLYPDEADLDGLILPEELASEVIKWDKNWYELERRVQSDDDKETPTYAERKAFDDRGLELTRKLAASFGHLYRFRYCLAWHYCSAFEESKENPGWIVVDKGFNNANPL